MKTFSPFFIWVLPVVWVLNSSIALLSPGSDYSIWGIASLAGAWVAHFLSHDAELRRLSIPIWIAGSALLLLLGALLDRLHASRRFWGISFAGAGILFSAATMTFLRPLLESYGKAPVVSCIPAGIALGFYFALLLTALHALAKAAKR